MVSPASCPAGSRMCCRTRFQRELARALQRRRFPIGFTIQSNTPVSVTCAEVAPVAIHRRGRGSRRRVGDRPGGVTFSARILSARPTERSPLAAARIGMARDLSAAGRGMRPFWPAAESRCAAYWPVTRSPSTAARRAGIALAMSPRRETPIAAAKARGSVTSILKRNVCAVVLSTTRRRRQALGPCR